MKLPARATRRRNGWSEDLPEQPTRPPAIREDVHARFLRVWARERLRHEYARPSPDHGRPHAATPPDDALFENAVRVLESR